MSAETASSGGKGGGAAGSGPDGSGAGGHAGGTGGAGGSPSSGGCSCDTAPATRHQLGFSLALFALAFAAPLARRRLPAASRSSQRR